ncbi:MAG: NADH-quinone oxidoreductase subunit NuoG [Thiohalocapsa sp.]|jgi:NADH-quinone oxidoreductase subunit G|uniref:NADH-quinone oxidoreductase subunit NuoG n=1 Tax=Thiohalocapsa sp. TaxID=2497641 RepID=UPI0025CD2977|nr:NADH-quinone oxidoreductase subunit NuoG [Thiohalocapsa sp.]MCG6940146.1 NADH-quinone oxidoreductase subunit NuoG [Thiohalocapsa sp.]
MTEQISIEIDGRTCAASPGEMIIAVADREGIPIPRFCYHEKLSIAANCRMCLVEAEAGGRPFPKPVPACATPVADGMKVQTRSPKALDAQRGTMEFLLINHPLDCPICDQGGECELQDVSMGYGDDVSRFSERKRVVKDEDLGPLIATDMTRCIHCTRCVRFGAEIAGVRELGATGRGEDMRIGTFVQHTVAHELSGNIIDLCPVGALTSKPYRFTARAWELTSEEGVAPHDAVGSNIHLHIRGGRVMRVHPRDNEAVNETWISDRDRFSYEALNSDTRLTAPMVKRDGTWRPVEWQEALHLAADALRTADPEQIGWLMAPNATLEECYLAQRLLRALGGRHIDTRLRRQDFRGDRADPAVPWLGVPIAELEHQQAILLIGSDIRQEQPLLAHRIRKAVLNDATVSVVNPYQLALTHPARHLTAPPGRLAARLAAIASALSVSGSGAAAELIRQADPGEAEDRLAAELRAAGEQGRGLVLLGALAEADPDYTLLKDLAYLIAEAARCRIGFLPGAANAVGAALAGAQPHLGPAAAPVESAGLDALAMITEPRGTYVLWGVSPELDLFDPSRAREALAGAERVIACSAFRTPDLEAAADLLLPISAFAETSGTFVNAEGRWQRFQGVVAPVGDARPGWKVLRVLGTMLELDGFDYSSGKQVHDELAALCGDTSRGSTEGADTWLDNTRRGDYGLQQPLPVGNDPVRVGNVPIYAIDQTVRAAPALQRTPLAGRFELALHPDDATRLGLAEGDRAEVTQGARRAVVPVVLDDTLAPGAVRLPAAVAGSEQLGPAVGPIQLQKTTEEQSA